MNMPENWANAIRRSYGRYKNSLYTALDFCVTEDGAFCPYLRQIRVGKTLYTNCIFTRCIKEYPEVEDLEELT